MFFSEKGVHFLHLDVSFVGAGDTYLTYFFISRCVFLVFSEKKLVLLFILWGYFFSHFLPPFGRSTAFLSLENAVQIGAGREAASGRNDVSLR